MIEDAEDLQEVDRRVYHGIRAGFWSIYICLLKGTVPAFDQRLRLLVDISRFQHEAIIIRTVLRNSLIRSYPK